MNVLVISRTRVRTATWFESIEREIVNECERAFANAPARHSFTSIYIHAYISIYLYVHRHRDREPHGALFVQTINEVAQGRYAQFARISIVIIIIIVVIERLFGKKRRERESKKKGCSSWVCSCYVVALGRATNGEGEEEEGEGEKKKTFDVRTESTEIVIILRLFLVLSRPSFCMRDIDNVFSFSYCNRTAWSFIVRLCTQYSWKRKEKEKEKKMLADDELSVRSGRQMEKQHHHGFFLFFLNSEIVPSFLSQSDVCTAVRWTSWCNGWFILLTRWRICFCIALMNKFEDT